MTAHEKAAGYPKVTSRSKLAWDLLRLRRSFWLTHNGGVYSVDRMGNAYPPDYPASRCVRASFLLDPAKRNVHGPH